MFARPSIRALAVLHVSAFTIGAAACHADRSPAAVAEITIADAGSKPAAPSGPCPTGMALIDGDSCTDLELTCLDQTSTPWNGKTICRLFAEPTVCKRRTHRRYCIDLYEYPNRAGLRPTVMNDFRMAQTLCAEEHKRVCTANEWTTACEGPAYKPYPYGYERDATICRGDQTGIKPDAEDDAGEEGDIHRFKFASNDASVRAAELERLWQGVESGSEPRCVSDYGVFDMTGNADELVATEDRRAPYDSATSGGPWLRGVRNQCRPKVSTHDEKFAYYDLSFRCCAEADGAPTDPRSPKQIARGEAWRSGGAAVRDSWSGNPLPTP